MNRELKERVEAQKQCSPGGCVPDHHACSVVGWGGKVRINSFIKPLSTTILTEKIAEFYAQFPLSFTPVNLDVSRGDTGDYSRVMEYLRFVS